MSETLVSKESKEERTQNLWLFTWAIERLPQNKNPALSLLVPVTEAPGERTQEAIDKRHPKHYKF